MTLEVFEFLGEAIEQQLKASGATGGGRKGYQQAEENAS